MLESNNVGVFLRNSRWDWEKPRSNGEQLGLGMYPHFDVSDAAAMVEKARKAGYRVVQEPRKYDFGTEAFIADPDGFINVCAQGCILGIGCAQRRRARKLRGIFDEAAICNDLLVESVFRKRGSRKNAAITPEINEPRRTNGMPSKISARNENQKFCQLNANQVIVSISHPSL